MPSINDALKEKFGVSGSNIADSISKLNSVGVGGDLLVTIQGNYNDEQSVLRFDKTAREIFEAFPFVKCVVSYQTEEEICSMKADIVKCSETVGEPKQFGISCFVGPNTTINFYAETLDSFPYNSPSGDTPANVA